MKKFKNVLISKEKMKQLMESGAEPRTLKILDHMISNGTNLKNSLNENGIVGFEALDMAEDLVDQGYVTANALDDFSKENEMVDRAMAKAIAEGGARDFADENEIFKMLAE